MKLEIVCVYDRAIQAYGRPFFVAATGGAIRSFLDELRNKESDLSKHPEDYDLFHLGSYEDSSAQFNIFAQPVMLLAGRSSIELTEVRRVS